MLAMIGATLTLPEIGEAALSTNAQSKPAISLDDTLSGSALADIRKGFVEIIGNVGEQTDSAVMLRVTTGNGLSSVAKVPAKAGKFRLRYPTDFHDAPKLRVGALFIDATTDDDFDVTKPNHRQTEATIILYDESGTTLPTGFTSGLIDREGRTDEKCSQWNEMRSLINLYLHSEGAMKANAERQTFDLAIKTDLEWFKNNLTLYEFRYRDRDWSHPLNHRVARTFWQSVWNTWFNSSNDNPLDGNPKNNSPDNYRPYVFSNDFADLLIMHVMRIHAQTVPEENILAICREAAQNLMAMQHRTASNFCVPDWQGKRETYTAGAFHYGMFNNGEYMTERTGWFYNPAFHDYAAGGVLNGRDVWGLGEMLKADPDGPIANDLRESIALALRFCLHDGKKGGYVKTTPQGRVYWRDAGEHAYLLLGMLAAYSVDPDMPVTLAPNDTQTLRKLCINSLSALVELESPDHQWSIYPNVDAMGVAALAEGTALMPKEPEAARWRSSAMQVADAWITAKADPKEREAPCVNFGLLISPGRMTYIWSKGGMAQFFYYQTGHWIHALADLYALTGEKRYYERAMAMVRYLCGQNPFRVRLFNEMGGVYNWTDDTNGDGVEDKMKQDMYPESTAFCQIGILHLIAAINKRG
jgi:hypothetical protein